MWESREGRAFLLKEGGVLEKMASCEPGNRNGDVIFSLPFLLLKSGNLELHAVLLSKVLLS